MKHLALLLIFVGGCVTTQAASVPKAEIAAEIAVRYAAAMLAQKDNKPDEPVTTRCNKCTNGKVKTGDGLDWTQCECGDACECKDTGVLNPEPPPLVPVEQPNVSTGDTQCQGGTCYIIDNRTGKRYRIIK